MHRWSLKELNDISDIAFINFIPQERMDSSNVNSPLGHKIKAIQDRLIAGALFDESGKLLKSYKPQGSDHLERYVYVNGVFFDRVSNTAEEMAKSLGKKIDRVVPYNCAICGPSEKVYLVD